MLMMIVSDMIIWMMLLLNRCWINMASVDELDMLIGRDKWLCMLTQDNVNEDDMYSDLENPNFRIEWWSICYENGDDYTRDYECLYEQMR